MTLSNRVSKIETRVATLAGANFEAIRAEWLELFKDTEPNSPEEIIEEKARVMAKAGISLADAVEMASNKNTIRPSKTRKNCLEL
jgi:hypothetical protein